MQSPNSKPRRSLKRGLGKATLSALALGAVATAGVLTTSATFTDEVTMAQVSVAGGTLDLTANDGNGPGQAWSGTLSAAVTNMQPGDERSGTVVLKNVGTLPFSMTVSKVGGDTSTCFGYYFRETAATGATKAASHPVNISAMGTATGGDATTAPFATPVTNQALADAGADTTWETDDIKTYTLTVRMKSACNVNGASGTLDFDFDATQV